MRLCVTCFRISAIGIRAALGASPAGILRTIMRQGITILLAGFGIALTGAMALSRVLRGLLFGVAPNDPFTLLSTAAVLASAALLAIYFPAGRAARIVPVIALHQD